MQSAQIYNGINLKRTGENMEMNEKFLIFIDIMGFEEKANYEEHITGRPVEDIRLNYQSSVEIRLNKLKNEKVILHFQKMSSDSWLLFSANFADVFKSIKNILTTKMEFEVAIDIRKFSKSIEEELIALSNEAINFLKSNIIGSYTKWYKSINKESPKKTFILVTGGAYDHFKRICSEPYSNAGYYIIEYKEFEMLFKGLKVETTEKPMSTQPYSAIFGKSYSGEYITLQSPDNNIWPPIFSISIDLPTFSYVYVEATGSVFMRNASTAFALQIDDNDRDITTHRYCYIAVNRDKIGNNLPPRYATLGFQDSKVFYLSPGRHIIYLLGIATDLVQQDSTAQVNFMTFSIIANQNGSIDEESINYPALKVAISIV